MNSTMRAVSRRRIRSLIISHLNLVQIKYRRDLSGFMNHTNDVSGRLKKKLTVIRGRKIAWYTTWQGRGRLTLLAMIRNIDGGSKAGKSLLIQMLRFESPSWKVAYVWWDRPIFLLTCLLRKSFIFYIKTRWNGFIQRSELFNLRRKKGGLSNRLIWTMSSHVPTCRDEAGGILRPLNEQWRQGTMTRKIAETITSDWGRWHAQMTSKQQLRRYSRKT